ncbi:MAG: glycosyltransferase family 2 protein [Ferrimicrobium sp.]
MTVDVVIVDYRSGTVGPLVDSLVGEGVRSITIVDNAASEPSREERERGATRIATVSFGQNLGYGAACNRIAPELDGDFVLVVNPDISISTGAIDRLVETASSRADVALVGPKVCRLDGSTYPSFRRFPSLLDSVVHAAFGTLWPNNPMTRRYRRLDASPSVPVLVEWISGAFMLIRREAFMAVGGFDPSYLLYLEDVDLCRRFGLRGYLVVYEPRVEVLHSGGGATRSRRRWSLLQHHRSMLRYGIRSQNSTIAVMAVTFGVGVRLLLQLLSTLGAKTGDSGLSAR